MTNFGTSVGNTITEVVVVTLGGGNGRESDGLMGSDLGVSGALSKGLEESDDVVDVNVFVAWTGVDVALRAGAVAGGEAVVEFNQVVDVDVAVVVEVGGGAGLTYGGGLGERIDSGVESKSY